MTGPYLSSIRRNVPVHEFLAATAINFIFGRSKDKEISPCLDNVTAAGCGGTSTGGATAPDGVDTQIQVDVAVLPMDSQGDGDDENPENGGSDQQDSATRVVDPLENRAQYDLLRILTQMRNQAVEDVEGHEQCEKLLETPECQAERKEREELLEDDMANDRVNQTLGGPTWSVASQGRMLDNIILRDRLLDDLLRKNCGVNDCHIWEAARKSAEIGEYDKMMEEVVNPSGQ